LSYLGLSFIHWHSRMKVDERMAKAAKSQDQRTKFIEAAHRAECEPDEKAFDAALKLIAKAPATKPAKKARKPSK
jgi:hypothetical protein